MTTNNVGTITINLGKARKLKGEEKLVAFRGLHHDLKNIELAAAMNPEAVSADQIRGVRNLLPEIRSTLNRLEAAQKRR